MRPFHELFFGTSVAFAWKRNFEIFGKRIIFGTRQRNRFLLVLVHLAAVAVANITVIWKNHKPHCDSQPVDHINQNCLLDSHTKFRDSLLLMKRVSPNRPELFLLRNAWMEYNQMFITSKDPNILKQIFEVTKRNF